MFAPAGALIHPGMAWRAVADDVIVASWEVQPEQLEVRLELRGDGSLRRLSLARWGNAGGGHCQYIPFGVEFHAERRFGELVLPSELTAGWWFDTPRYARFFEATIIDAVPVG